jgi:hypothetical protein
MKLLLRPTVLTGEKLKDDYCVFHEGRSVGRIMLASDRSWRGVCWDWFINPPPPIPAWGHGTANSLDAAKAEFRSASFLCISDAEADRDLAAHRLKERTWRMTMGPAIKDKLVAERLYDRETCDVMSNTEAERLWRLHQEAGQACRLRRPETSRRLWNRSQ